MGIRQYKPTTPGRRQASVSDFSELTDRKKKPEKSLLRPLHKTGGRNNQGVITVRFRGGGHKRMYRVIDFKRKKDGVWATVVAIEYDPNRSARIALLQYEDGTKTYILAPIGLKKDDRIMSGDTAEPRPGNCMPLKKVPLGMSVEGDLPTFGVTPRSEGYAIFGAEYDEDECKAGDPLATEPTAPMEIGDTGDMLSFTSFFDGWGYVHLFKNEAGKMTSLDTYAVDEAHELDKAEGYGDLSVHEVATSLVDNDLLYFAYYSAGLRVAAEKHGPLLIERLPVFGADGQPLPGEVPRCVLLCRLGSRLDPMATGRQQRSRSGREPSGLRDQWRRARRASDGPERRPLLLGDQLR